MNQKNQKGITLIALVITIIVLLILAGVTINMVLGDNGIIKQAQAAKQAQEKGEKDDKNAITDAQRELSKYSMPKYDNVKDSETNLAKENSTIDGKGVSYNNPVIPKGFKTVNVGEAIWGEAGAIDKGLVIADEVGNEFVWVPVPNAMYNTTTNPTGMFEQDEEGNYKSKLHRTSGSGIGDEPAINDYDKEEMNIKAIIDDGYEVSADGISKQFQDEFNSMAKSVKVYGGFYVGRYETGWNANEGVVISKSGVYSMTVGTDLGAFGWKCGNMVFTEEADEMQEGTLATWYGLYAKQKELYGKESSVVSGMIYGCQWDAIMNWMLKGTEAEEKYVTDSRDRGVHTGETEHTGTEGYDVKNIYDLGGLQREYTQEKGYYNYVMTRGGDSSMWGGYGAGDRYCSDDSYSISCTDGDGGSRLQLYIK